MLTTPRWTHIALPSLDIDASVAWYEKYTPLVELDRREDADGRSAWLAHEGQVENPFVLVLVMFYRSQGTPQPQLGPFAPRAKKGLGGGGRSVGGVDVQGATRDELYERARKLGVKGRSNMNKTELGRA